MEGESNSLSRNAMHLELQPENNIQQIEVYQAVNRVESSDLDALLSTVELLQSQGDWPNLDLQAPSQWNEHQPKEASSLHQTPAPASNYTIYPQQQQEVQSWYHQNQQTMNPSWPTQENSQWVPQQQQQAVFNPYDYSYFDGNEYHQPAWGSYNQAWNPPTPYHQQWQHQVHNPQTPPMNVRHNIVANNHPQHPLQVPQQVHNPQIPAMNVRCQNLPQQHPLQVPQQVQQIQQVQQVQQAQPPQNYPILRSILNSKPNPLWPSNPYDLNSSQQLLKLRQQQAGPHRRPKKPIQKGATPYEVLNQEQVQGFEGQRPAGENSIAIEIPQVTLDNPDVPTIE